MSQDWPPPTYSQAPTNFLYNPQPPKYTRPGADLVESYAPVGSYTLSVEQNVSVGMVPYVDLPTWSTYSRIGASFTFWRSNQCSGSKQEPPSPKYTKRPSASYVISENYVSVRAKLKVLESRGNTFKVMVPKVKAKNCLGSFWNTSPAFFKCMQVSHLAQMVYSEIGTVRRTSGYYKIEQARVWHCPTLRDHEGKGMNFFQTFAASSPAATSLSANHAGSQYWTFPEGNDGFSSIGMHLVVDLKFNTSRWTERANRVCRLVIFTTGPNLIDDLNRLRDTRKTIDFAQGSLTLGVDREGYVQIELKFTLDAFDAHSRVSPNVR